MSNSFDFLLPSLNETYSNEAIAVFRLKMHINAFLTIIFDSLAVYLILFTSDRAIGTYRWFLLNIVVSSFAYDVFVTAGFMPLPLVPVAGVCTLGMLRMKGDVLFGVFVPMMCVVQLLACCGMSALLAVIYRLAAVYNVQKRLFTRRSLFVLVVVQVLWGAPTNAVAYMALLDAVRNQDVIAGNAVQERAYLRNVVENELCGFSTMSESFWLRTTVWIGGIQIAIAVVLAIGCWILSISALYKERSKMSAKRFYLQRELIFALALQLAIPVLTLLVPFSLSTISLLWKVHVEEQAFVKA
ncbi:Protein SRI-61 [Aphelenchoides avenae]|nr:Protein SRI-61 [Aphelenchus avenae]